MKLSKVSVMLGALLAVSAVQAHNVWLEPAQAKGEYVIKFGHEQTETYPEQKLKAVRVLDAAGKVADAKFQFKNGEAYLAANGASEVFVLFDNGVWSKLPSGKYVEKTKREEPTAELSMNPVKFGKAVLKWDEQAFKAHGLDYELVPQAKAQAGKPLSILVLHKGQPVKGIKVGKGEDMPFNLSNDKGIAEFTPEKGYNKVWAEFEEKVSGNPDYDSRSIEYMLTFDAE